MALASPLGDHRHSGANSAYQLALDAWADVRARSYQRRSPTAAATQETGLLVQVTGHRSAASSPAARQPNSVTARGGGAPHWVNARTGVHANLAIASQVPRFCLSPILANLLAERPYALASHW
jgi:hypothetical protein